MELESLAVKLEEENDRLIKEKVIYLGPFPDFYFKNSLRGSQF